MENSEVKKIVGDTPCMQLGQANQLTSFMEENGLKNVLELGFAFGVSTAYMAAALGRTDGGSIVTIDRLEARENKPNIECLLAKIGEAHRVQVYFEPTSYTWRLMKFLEQNPRPQFDMCYVDGAHSWFVDGFAFFLVHLLLKPGGWIIFDDLDWSYDSSYSLKNSDFVKAMPEDERATPQVRKIFELLVRPHPDFFNFKVEGDWAYAQKRTES